MSSLITLTYMGIIARPIVGLMYTIVSVTILYYLSSAVMSVTEFYKSVLLETVHVAEHICTTEWYRTLCLDQPNNDLKIITQHEESDVPGVSKSLYFYVVEKEKPIRVHIFLATLKLAFTSMVIYFAIDYMIEFHRQDKIQPATQALAAIFISYIPHVLGVFHSSASHHMNDIVMEKRIIRVVKSYLMEKCEHKEH